MYKVEMAPPNMKGFDNNYPKITLEKAQEFYNSGYRFCVRYLSLGANESHSDLTADEVKNILDGGLALMPVQHVMYYGWSPTEKLGAAYGHSAAIHAQEVGVLPKTNVWLDLEGVNSNASIENTIAYCNAWYYEVFKAGFTPGIYIGPVIPLTPEDLYYKLHFKHYWKSGARVPDVYKRGYQMKQSLPKQVHGIEIDEDETQNDNFGDGVFWMVKDNTPA